MGLLFWRRKGKNAAPQAARSPDDKKGGGKEAEAEGMHGAVEVRRRPSEVTVFEFGWSGESSSGQRVTLAGYCPVSDDLEPCRWEMLPALHDDAPQFRIVF